jgi:hypothetical protein
VLDDPRSGLVHLCGNFDPRRSRYLELRAMAGDTNAKKRPNSEVENYTICFDLPVDILSALHNPRGEKRAEDRPRNPPHC